MLQRNSNFTQTEC